MQHTSECDKKDTVAEPKPSGPETDEDALLIPDELKGRQPEQAIHIEDTQIPVSNIHFVTRSRCDSKALC